MSAHLRMLDANLNRAREALRTLEDVVRFVLDDGELCKAIKAARHGLREIGIAAGVDETRLLAWRDTPGDVGTSHTTAAEAARQDVQSVAIAAGKRVGEAMRVIEETCKLDAGLINASALAKSLRYRVYELEKRVVLAMAGVSGSGQQWAVCVLLTEALCAHHSWEHVARQALEAGVGCLQLREKMLESGELLERARRLVGLCREFGAASVVNDRADIAILSGASGVHVGQMDLSITDVRALAGTRLMVGLSTSTMQEARAGATAGANVMGVGPMFATTTKHKPVLSGPQYLEAYLGDPVTARVPHLAIGGITIENVQELTQVGCKGIAVSSAVCSAKDPGDACKRLLEAIRG